MRTIPGGSPISRVPSMSKLMSTGDGRDGPSTLEAHGFPVRQPDVLGLTRLEHEPFGEDRSRCAAGFLVELGRSRIAVDEAPATDDGQLDAAVELGVANHRLGLATFRH